MSVREILKEKGGSVFSVPPNVTIGDVARELTGKRVGAVLVMDGPRLAGILSERDIVRVLAAQGADALSHSASRVMTHNVETCGLDDLIEQVMERMTKSRFRHMPVVDEGVVVGLVSIGDVVKQRIANADREREEMRAYIMST
ncbi:MAG: CBS domain-containing protein [Pseudomonadota bacterium]